MNLLREALAAGGLDGSDGGSAPAEALTWDQRPALTAAYLEEVTYDPSDYTDSEIDNYAPASPAVANTRPVGATVQLPAGTLTRGNYRQVIAAAGPVELLNDIPGVVTPYTVLDEEGKVIAAGSLHPTGALRWIKCQIAPNVRDLGGWACDGGTVRYGLLLRGGEPGLLDKDVLVDQCGIRHELQLRGAEEAPRPYSLLGVGYTCATNYVWYTVEPESWDTWRTNLGCIFNNAASKIPVYFHCSVGADRTGTLACVLLCILGVSPGNVDKESELTCFSTGTGSDAAARRRNENDWKGLINGLLGVELPSGAADTLMNHAIQFTLDLGFTAAQINAFRAAMIDGTPSTAAYGIKFDGDNVSISNEIGGVLAGTAFSGTISADDGYVIDSVTVTMGETDVTATAYNSQTGAISIASVTGEVAITVSASQQQSNNVFSIGVLNSRLNTSETNPAQNGSFIHGWIPLTQDQLSGNIVVRSNMDVINYGNLLGGGDYIRFYPSETANSYLTSQSLTNTRDWLSYDSTSGIYTLTIPHAHFAAYASQITCMRFCAQVAAEPLTESFFDGCILTINEEL